MKARQRRQARSVLSESNALYLIFIEYVICASFLAFSWKALKKRAAKKRTTIFRERRAPYIRNRSKLLLKPITIAVWTIRPRRSVIQESDNGEFERHAG